jgi:hypothetical protein
VENSSPAKKRAMNSIYRREGGDMLCKIGNNNEVLTVLLLVGSHSVSSALLKGQPVTAILEALTVCACVLIFVGALWLSDSLKIKVKPSFKSHARKRQTKKLRPEKAQKNFPSRLN